MCYRYMNTDVLKSSTHLRLLPQSHVTSYAKVLTNSTFVQS